MSRKAQSTHWDPMAFERIHQEKMMRKVQKIDGLKALLEMWEGHEDEDHAYILELRARLRSAQNQLAAMSI